MSLCDMRLWLTAFVLVFMFAGCKNDGCPQDDYPTRFSGYLDWTIFRGLSSDSDFSFEYIGLYDEYDANFEPTGRFEIRVGWCDFVVEPNPMCEASSDGTVSLIIVEPADWTCEWDTVGGDHAVWDINSTSFWWNEDSLDISLSGPVTFTGTGGTDTGSVIFSYDGAVD